MLECQDIDNLSRWLETCVLVGVIEVDAVLCLTLLPILLKPGGITCNVLLLLLASLLLLSAEELVEELKLCGCSCDKQGQKPQEEHFGDCLEYARAQKNGLSTLIASAPVFLKSVQVAGATQRQMPRASWLSLVNSAKDASDDQFEVDSEINHRTSS